MEVKAIQKYLIASPKKIREVVPLIKKLSPQDAVERLPFVGKRATEPLMKTITSAIANAKQKGIEAGDLVFKEIQINEGPRLKRFRAGARGRAKPYKRRMSHIRVVLTTKPEIQSTKSETVERKENKIDEKNMDVQRKTGKEKKA